MDVEVFVDPVCPFCWVTESWVRRVQRLRGLDVVWRFISLRMLNEGAYEDKPEGYPEAHMTGLRLLRVLAAAKDDHGNDAVARLYEAMGTRLWETPLPDAADFDDILAHQAWPQPVEEMLADAGLPAVLATATDVDTWDAVIRSDTDEALARTGGGIGTPVISFDPPEGPAFFGPVIAEVPDGDEALRLWDAVRTLAYWPGFAELKRTTRWMPRTATLDSLGMETTTAR